MFSFPPQDKGILLSHDTAALVSQSGKGKRKLDKVELVRRGWSYGDSACAYERAGEERKGDVREEIRRRRQKQRQRLRQRQRQKQVQRYRETETERHRDRGFRQRKEERSSIQSQTQSQSRKGGGGDWRSESK